MTLISHIVTLGLLGPIGWTEIVIILVVVLVLFGGAKLPELARGLGKGLREFKSELQGTKEEIEDLGRQDDKEEGGKDQGEAK